MTERRPDSLHVEQDLTFERRSWAVERAGWGVLLVVVVAALLGLCGSAGPLGRGSAGDERDPISLTFARFPRHAAPTTLEIRIRDDVSTEDRVRLWIDRAFLDRFELVSVTPEPESVELGEDRLTYVFPVGEPGVPATVAFNLLAEGYGSQTGRVGLSDGPSLRVRQFVYP